MEHDGKIDQEAAPAEPACKTWTEPTLTIVSMAVADTKGAPGSGSDLGSPSYNAS